MTKTYLIRSFFILNIFIGLVRLESGLCAAAPHVPVAAPAAVELVVPAVPHYAVSFYCAPFFPAPLLENSCAADSSINKFILIDYNAFTLQLLKSNTIISSHSLQLVSTLQKCHIWHESSGDASPLA